MLSQAAFGVKNLPEYQPDVGSYLLRVLEYMVIELLQYEPGAGCIGAIYQIGVMNMPGAQCCYLLDRAW